MNRRNFLGLLFCAPLAAISGMWSANLSAEGAVLIHPNDVQVLFDTSTRISQVLDREGNIRILGQLFQESLNVPAVLC